MDLQDNTNVKEGDICPSCREGTLVFVGEDEPWHTDYLICDKCDGTYCIRNREGEDDAEKK